MVWTLNQWLSQATVFVTVLWEQRGGHGNGFTPCSPPWRICTFSLCLWALLVLVFSVREGMPLTEWDRGVSANLKLWQHLVTGLFMLTGRRHRKEVCYGQRYLTWASLGARPLLHGGREEYVWDSGSPRRGSLGALLPSFKYTSQTTSCWGHRNKGLPHE